MDARNGRVGLHIDAETGIVRNLGSKAYIGEARCVAMAEAAIGSGLATLIFLYAIRRTGGGDAGREKE